MEENLGKEVKRVKPFDFLVKRFVFGDHVGQLKCQLKLLLLKREESERECQLKLLHLKRVERKLRGIQVRRRRKEERKK